MIRESKRSRSGSIIKGTLSMSSHGSREEVGSKAPSTHGRKEGRVPHPETAAKTLKDLNSAEHEVITALKFFQGVVSKNTVCLLDGVGSKILDALLLVQNITGQYAGAMSQNSEIISQQRDLCITMASILRFSDGLVDKYNLATSTGYPLSPRQEIFNATQFVVEKADVKQMHFLVDRMACQLSEIVRLTGELIRDETRSAMQNEASRRLKKANLHLQIAGPLSSSTVVLRPPTSSKEGNSRKPMLCDHSLFKNKQPRTPPTAQHRSPSSPCDMHLCGLTPPTTMTSHGSLDPSSPASVLHPSILHHYRHLSLSSGPQLLTCSSEQNFGSNGGSQTNMRHVRSQSSDEALGMDSNLLRYSPSQTTFTSSQGTLLGDQGQGTGGGSRYSSQQVYIPDYESLDEVLLSSTTAGRLKRDEENSSMYTITTVQPINSSMSARSASAAQLASHRPDYCQAAVHSEDSKLGGKESSATPHSTQLLQSDYQEPLYDNAPFQDLALHPNSNSSNFNYDPDEKSFPTSQMQSAVPVWSSVRPESLYDNLTESSYDNNTQATSYNDHPVSMDTVVNTGAAILDNLMQTEKSNHITETSGPEDDSELATKMQAVADLEAQLRSAQQLIAKLKLEAAGKPDITETSEGVGSQKAVVPTSGAPNRAREDTSTGSSATPGQGGIGGTVVCERTREAGTICHKTVYTAKLLAPSRASPLTLPSLGGEPARPQELPLVPGLEKNGNVFDPKYAVPGLESTTTSSSAGWVEIPPPPSYSEYPSNQQFPSNQTLNGSSGYSESQTKSGYILEDGSSVIVSTATQSDFFMTSPATSQAHIVSPDKGEQMPQSASQNVLPGMVNGETTVERHQEPKQIHSYMCTFGAPTPPSAFFIEQIEQSCVKRYDTNSSTFAFREKRTYYEHRRLSSLLSSSKSRDMDNNKAHSETSAGASPLARNGSENQLLPFDTRCPSEDDCISLLLGKEAESLKAIFAEQDQGSLKYPTIQEAEDATSDTSYMTPEQVQLLGQHVMSETQTLPNLPSQGLIHPTDTTPELGIINATGSDERPSPDAINVLDLTDVSHLLLKKLPKGEDVKEGRIKGGTVDALIAHVTIDSKDFMYCEAFLSTYPTFVSPHSLIEKLAYRYNKFKRSYSGGPPASKSIARRAYVLLVRAVGELGHLRDSRIQESLRELEYLLIEDGDFRLGKVLREKISATFRRHKDTTFPLLPSPAYYSKKASAQLLDFKPLDLAHEATSIASRLFQRVELAEILDWASHQREEQAPNLTRFTEHFNSVSFWTRTQLLTCSKSGEREKLYHHFIKFMKKLRGLNNFNTYLAILSALQSAPICRLDWPKHLQEKVDALSDLADCRSSFKNYRTTLASAEHPCIPYLGLVLQDLTFIHCGNPDFLDEQKTIINFSKSWQQFFILDEIRIFKQFSDYGLARHERIEAYFDCFQQQLSEEELYRISLSIKPRATGSSCS